MARRVTLALSGCLLMVCTGLPAVSSAEPAADPSATCNVGTSKVTNVMAAENWRPLHPEKWQFPGTEVIQAQRGDDPGPPRRPFEYATLLAGPRFASVQIDAEVRIDEPVTRNDRDVVILWGWQSDTQFYYTHLSQDNTIYPHNGIFVVNNADRLRIDDQWNGTIGAPPSIKDTNYHKIRVRYCAETGRISVYVDTFDQPRITATNKTFGAGRIGFGSFDNFGRIRNLTITGTDEADLCGGRTPTILGTDHSDLLHGTPGDDVINARGGADLIAGDGGNDLICGGDGTDLINAGPGDDTVYGGPGTDLLLGGPGDDTLYGGPDRDLLLGAPGHDTLQEDGPAH